MGSQKLKENKYLAEDAILVETIHHQLREHESRIKHQLSLIILIPLPFSLSSLDSINICSANRSHYTAQYIQLSNSLKTFETFVATYKFP